MHAVSTDNVREIRIIFPALRIFFSNDRISFSPIVDQTSPICLKDDISAVERVRVKFCSISVSGVMLHLFKKTGQK